MGVADGAVTDGELSRRRLNGRLRTNNSHIERLGDGKGL